MHKRQLNKADTELLVELRKNAERITHQVPEEEKPQVLDEAYAWRYDNIYTVTERH
jgi:hypothetical protein